MNTEYTPEMLSSVPEVFTQWHPTKNTLDCDKMTRGSSQKVWWQCEQGHEWEAIIANRTKNHTTCPYCAGKRAIAGVNDLSTLYPDVALQWHPTKNGDIVVHDVMSQSRKKAWWICNEGHEWEAIIQSRTKDGNNCPYCAGKKILQGYNDLATINPDIALQWHPTKNLPMLPTQIAAQSNQKMWWQCDIGHEWEAVVSNRTAGKTGCPYCQGTRINTGENDLLSKHPHIAEQWDKVKNSSLSLDNIHCGSSRKVWWKCTLGHEWEATVVSRINSVSRMSRYEGCPVCSGQQVLVGFNDLQSKNPEIAAEWHPTKNGELLPTQVTVGSSRAIWWQCSNVVSHIWEAKVAGRVRQHSGCPTCKNKRVEVLFNDLASTFPDIAAEWHQTKNNRLSASDIVTGSGYKAWWQCKLGHEWEARVVDRTSESYGCPVCTNKKVSPGFNDLSTVTPNLASEWHENLNGGLKPTDVTHKSGKTVTWICKNNHVWNAVVANRSNGSGCPQCGLNVSKAENEVYEFVKALMDNSEVVQSERSVIHPYELDIFVPDKKFAIEFNGCYWHSEAGGKDRHYHAHKVSKCDEAGIELYQVWDDDWRLRKQIVMRGIAHRLGLVSNLNKFFPEIPLAYTEVMGARKLIPCEVSYDDACVFLDENHIQGRANGSYYFGLRDGRDVLRAVLVIKRTADPVTYTIDRYVSMGIVSGGFSKLLKHAESVVSGVRQWVTFADRSVSGGNLYDLTGFVVDKILAPDYSYLVDGQRVHKFNYRLARFKNDPELLYQDDLSERELAQLNNLLRVWDSGKVRYVKFV